MGGDEAADVAAEAGDFLDHTGANEGVGFLGHHEDRFNLFVQLAIHEGELEFEFKVGNGAEAADDRFALFGLDVIHEQAGEGVDLDVGKVLDGAGGEILALHHTEHRRFAFIDGDGNDDPIEKAGRTLDNIQVTVGDRIKTTGVNGCPHGWMVAEGAARCNKKEKQKGKAKSYTESTEIGHREHGVLEAR